MKDCFDCQHSAKLTRRQQEVLDQILKVRSTEQIAHILGLSFTTVAGHRRRLRQKLAVPESLAVAYHTSPQDHVSGVESANYELRCPDCRDRLEAMMYLIPRRDRRKN